MRRAIEQQLFSEEELSRYIDTSVSSERSILRHELWEQEKRRLGIMRVDLTKDLIKDENGFPIIEPYFGIPDAPLINFGAALSSEEYNFWVHFFIYDACFEQIWNPRYTERDLTILSKFSGTFTPDFTLGPQLSPAQEQFNVQRGRTIGQLCQGRGSKVIPTVGWSFRHSFDFCFLGLKEGGTVAISTNGVLRKFVSTRMFKEGVFELERQLRPENIVIVGQEIELNTKARQIWYPNEIITHLRGLRNR